MGNTTNPERWEARQRIEFIELSLWWRGQFRRGDLLAAFGISLPQASADIAAYERLNPKALFYDLRAKCYRAHPKMKVKITRPDLRSAISTFFSPEQKSATANNDCVATVDLPSRQIPPEIARPLFQSVLQRNAVQISYLSASSGTHRTRWIHPHAFAFDGYRWHVRAYCEEAVAYRDFVLGRIESASGTTHRQLIVPPDLDWSTWVELKLRPHPQLNEIQRRAVANDYGMVRGVCKLKVRKAMLGYTRAYLNLTPPARHLQQENENPSHRPPKPSGPHSATGEAKTIPNAG